jgi:hypothetical protein
VTITGNKDQVYAACKIVVAQVSNPYCDLTQSFAKHDITVSQSDDLDRISLTIITYHSTDSCTDP